MPNPYLFSPPQNIYKRSEMLYDLLENQEENGQIAVAAVARFLGMTTDSLRRVIQSGRCSFAFSSGMSGRETSYIFVDAFYNWIMQSRPYLIESITEREMESIKGQSYIAKRVNGEWQPKERMIKG